MLDNKEKEFNRLKARLTIIFESYYNLKKNYTDDKKFRIISKGDFTFKDMVSDFYMTKDEYQNKYKVHDDKISEEYNSKIDSRAKKTFRDLLFKVKSYKDLKYIRFISDLESYPFFQIQRTNNLLTPNDLLTPTISNTDFKEKLLLVAADNADIYLSKPEEELKALKSFNSLIVYSQTKQDLKFYRFELIGRDTVKITSLGDNFKKEVFRGKVLRYGNKITIDMLTPEKDSILKVMIQLNEVNHLESNCLLALTMSYSKNITSQETLLSKKAIISKLDSDYIHIKNKRAQPEIDELNSYSIFLNDYDILRINNHDLKMIKSLNKKKNFNINLIHFLEKIYEQGSNIYKSFDALNDRFQISKKDLFYIPFLEEYKSLIHKSSSQILSSMYTLEKTMFKAYQDIVKSHAFDYQLIGKDKNNQFKIQMVIDITIFDTLVYFENTNAFTESIINPINDKLDLKSPLIKYNKDESINFELTIIYKDNNTIKNLRDMLPKKYHKNIFKIQYIENNIETLNNVGRTFCLFENKLVMYKLPASYPMTLYISEEKNTIFSYKNSLSIISSIRRKLNE